MKDLTTHRLERRSWEVKYLINVAVFCCKIQGVKILQAIHREMYSNPLTKTFQLTQHAN